MTSGGLLSIENDRIILVLNLERVYRVETLGKNVKEGFCLAEMTLAPAYIEFHFLPVINIAMTNAVY